jgi:hypothetical protein
MIEEWTDRQDGLLAGSVFGTDGADEAERDDPGLVELGATRRDIADVSLDAGIEIWGNVSGC